MATTINITTGAGSSSHTVSTGARGPAGASGSDAEVTEANIIAALGYTPADDADLAGKQATLVSGTNIKTINSTSLLGSGNLEVVGDALTFDGDDPNATDQLSIAGVSTTGVNGFVIPAGTLNGKQFWSNDGTQVLGAGNTVVYYDVQWIVARGSSYRAVAMQNVASPVGLNYTLHVGSGTATVANVPYVASFLGQWCKATTAWWQWDGTAWIPRQTLSGQQITRSDADDAYFILGVDGDGAPTTSPFP